MFMWSAEPLSCQKVQWPTKGGTEAQKSSGRQTDEVVAGFKASTAVSVIHKHHLV